MRGVIVADRLDDVPFGEADEELLQRVAGELIRAVASERLLVDLTRARDEKQRFYDAIERLNRGVALCRERADNGTRSLLERILVEEERHADWLEAQLQQIQDMGLQNYLAQQVREEGS